MEQTQETKPVENPKETNQDKRKKDIRMPFEDIELDNDDLDIDLEDM